MKGNSLLIVGISLIAVGILGLVFIGPVMCTCSFLCIAPDKNEFSTLGEQIYFTGMGSKGCIPFKRGPMWFRMHGGGCSTCHGEDGRGGYPIHRDLNFAPDITYTELLLEDFDDESIKRAILEGLHEDSSQLE